MCTRSRPLLIRLASFQQQGLGSPQSNTGGLLMNSQTRLEIRFGLIALALSGLFFVVGAALRGPFDLANPGSYIARSALSPLYLLGWSLILVAAVLSIYGFFG